MQPLRLDHPVSMADFKRNPAQVLRHAKGQPVKVISRNGSAVYALTPKLSGELVEAMVETVADRELLALARQRLALKDTAIEVDIDQI